MITKPAHTQSTAASPDSQRRTILLGAAAAGLLGGQWTRPIVDSVILPAHAATTSAQQLQYFDDISDRVPLDSARRALLCVTLTDQGYIGQLAITFNDGQTDLFSSPVTPLGEVSIMSGVCQPGGPFLAQNPDQQSISVSFEEGVEITISAGNCELPDTDCRASNALSTENPGFERDSRASQWGG